MKWLLPESDVHFEGFKKSGSYQASLLKEAIKHCKQKRLAIDVGAHVGFLSWQMAAQFKRVLAFEPVPENVACFRHNNPGIPIIPIALGSKVGLMGLHNPRPENSGAWRLVEGSEITMMPLDFFNFPYLDLIKVDTQGFEREILLGAQATIKKHHPTLILEAVDKKTLEIEEGIQELLPDYEIKAVINRDLIAA